MPLSPARAALLRQVQDLDGTDVREIYTCLGRIVALQDTLSLHELRERRFAHGRTCPHCHCARVQRHGRYGYVPRAPSPRVEKASPLWRRCGERSLACAVMSGDRSPGVSPVLRLQDIPPRCGAVQEREANARRDKVDLAAT